MKTLYFILTTVILSLLCASCSKDEKISETDKFLFELTNDTTNSVWYKYSSELLAKSIGSGHTQPYLRTRYNAIAATQLDSVGKVAENTVFPEGSAIVKELYGNQTKIDLYAILYKDATNVDADANGWVWGYFYSDGSVKETSANRGNGCIDCHSQTGNVNQTLMNKYFP